MASVKLEAMRSLSPLEIARPVADHAADLALKAKPDEWWGTLMEGGHPPACRDRAKG
jgi:hypothetical protein